MLYPHQLGYQADTLNVLLRSYIGESEYDAVCEADSDDKGIGIR